jgi:hypothetical protein
MTRHFCDACSKEVLPDGHRGEIAVLEIPAKGPTDGQPADGAPARKVLLNCFFRVAEAPGVTLCTRCQVKALEVGAKVLADSLKPKAN